MSNKTILGDVGGSEMSKNITYEEWKALPRPDPKKMRLKSEIPKAALVEVTPRMHAAVKAKPDKLRMIAEDADGMECHGGQGRSCCCGYWGRLQFD